VTQDLLFEGHISEVPMGAERLAKEQSLPTGILMPTLCSRRDSNSQLERSTNLVTTMVSNTNLLCRWIDFIFRSYVSLEMYEDP
jgi:hypothetical protein